MESSWLALVNGLLLLAQAGVNIAYARCFASLARQYESLVSPASFAFAIWIPIYALEVLLVLTDLLYPQHSFFADATQPTQLRICFSLSCVFNIAWLVLYVHDYVMTATVMIFLLWLVLLVLYVYSVNDRTGRSGFDWKLYVCNELPIAMYFAWVTCMAFVHLSIALQESHDSYLSISTYVTHLSIIAVFALLAIIYAQDAIFALVAVWYFVAVSSKHVALPSKVVAADLSVRACAGEASGIVMAMLIISFLSMFLVDSKPTAMDEELTTVGGMRVGQAAPTYGTTSV